MSTEIEAFEQDLNSSETGGDWVEALENYVDCLPGSIIEYLGLDETSFLIERGRTLLVVLETAEENLGSASTGFPSGWKTAEENGWSYLGIISLQGARNTYKEVSGYITQLVSEGAFKAFDEILFVGMKRSCKLALTCAGIVENSKVLLIQPESSDSATGEFADGNPVQRALVAYDPSKAEAIEFVNNTRANETILLPCRHMGDRTAQFIKIFDLLPALFDMAFSEEPSRPAFFTQMRQQKRLHRAYWRGVLRKMDNVSKPKLSKMMCQSIQSTLGGRVFRRELRRIENL
ncbi:hypothetical protein [Cognatishimia activa]|uniref:hypothetical protein n=1 Tax=Cognatishimia activa TaxID=1715691 RepID=UPI002231A9E1|nr:hypothetical protein [Cognatishimia activa]UZD90619.1 hypothetical protein M0D42_13645 [Cognatishimia activa]